MSNNDTAYKGQHVLMLVGTHVYDDARVLPESNSLIDAGYKVSVIGIARYGGLPVKAVKDNVNILIAPMITTFNPLVLLKEFWRLVICKLGTITQSPTTSYRTSNIISIIFFTFWMIRLDGKPKSMLYTVMTFYNFRQAGFLHGTIERNGYMMPVKVRLIHMLYIHRAKSPRKPSNS